MRLSPTGANCPSCSCPVMDHGFRCVTCLYVLHPHCAEIKTACPACGCTKGYEELSAPAPTVGLLPITVGAMLLVIAALPAVYSRYASRPKVTTQTTIERPAVAPRPPEPVVDNRDTLPAATRTRTYHVQSLVTNRTPLGRIELVLGQETFQELLFYVGTAAESKTKIPEAHLLVEVSCAKAGRGAIWSLLQSPAARDVSGQWVRIKPSSPFNRVRFTLSGAAGDLYLGNVFTFPRPLELDRKRRQS